MSTQQTNPILSITARNTGVAVQFFVAVVVLLLPLFWTQLTGYPVINFDVPVWVLISAAIICGVIGIGASIPKTVTISTHGIDYTERGKTRFNLAWQDVHKVENSVRSIPTRAASNIHLITKDGTVHKLESAKINDKALKRIYSTIQQDVTGQYHHIRLVDHGGWSKSPEKVW